MIERIIIYDLFGQSEKKLDIEFNKDLTILVGKNGCGKTTILNILSCIFNNNFYELRKYNFDRIEVKYIKEELIIKKLERQILVSKNNMILDEALKDIESKANKFESWKSHVLKKYNNEELIIIDILRGIDDIHINEKFMNIDSLYFPTYRRAEIDFCEIFYDIDERRNDKYYRDSFIANTYFNDSRILRNNYFRENKFENIVLGISNSDIREIVKNEWVKISKIETLKLNSLISDFFFAFLDVNNKSKELDLTNINSKQINKKIKKIFTQTGLATFGEDTWESRIDEYTKSIEDILITREGFEKNNGSGKSLTQILEEFNGINSLKHSLSKIFDIIKIYEDTCKAIDKIKAPFKYLEEILTEFMQPKKVIIEEGRLLFKKNEDILEFEDLSAGEKQLVTLFVYASLATERKAIIMIDEPELSLHVTWQRKLIKNLLFNNKKIQYIISTHSPFIISEYNDYIKKIGEVDYE